MQSIQLRRPYGYDGRGAVARGGLQTTTARLLPLGGIEFVRVDPRRCPIPRPATTARLPLPIGGIERFVRVDPRRCPLPRPAASQSSSPSSPSSPSLEKLANQIQLLFPVWALISATTAYVHPSYLNWMTTKQFEQGVGLLMLAMGLSLTLDDFRNCLKQPVPILLGFVCQYSILPLLAFTISRLMSLPPSVACGMIILGSCPGGQASNVATFVAYGNVSLSVLMTTVSTMGAAVMTPLLSSVLAGRYVPIDGVGLAVSTVQLVLVPTVAGLLLNEFARKQVDVVRPFMPFVALFLTVVLCAVPVGIDWLILGRPSINAA